MLFLGTSAASIILVSGKEMSESQTKAGNHRKFEKNWKFEKIRFEKNRKFEKIWKFENLKFKTAEVYPRDMLNNFCFHV